MLTAIEQEVTRNLGISEKVFAERKAEHAALHTRELHDYITPTWHRVCRMARSVGVQPTAFLSHVVDQALQELDETGGHDDGNSEDDRPSSEYDAEVARMLGVATQELARAKAKRNERVALEQRNVAHASTGRLLLNLSERQLARVARHQQADGTFIPAAESDADEVSASDFSPPSLT